MNVKEKIKNNWKIKYPLLRIRQSTIKTLPFLESGKILKKRIKRRFVKELGYVPNLENPKTFNEKMQWIKINVRDKRMIGLADKYLVRSYVKNKTGERYLNKLLGVYKDANEIEFNKLPKSFVLKTNHGCGTNIIVKNKSKLDIKETRKKLNQWLRTNFGYGSGEWHYRHIKPLIICEEFLNDKSGKLMDYKIFCSYGDVKYIQVDVDRFKNHKRCFYNKQWNKQEFTLGFPFFEGEVEKPSNFNEMIKVAEKLSQPFPLVRVDLYNIKGKIIFGEITFTHGSGFEKFHPKEWDLKMGKEFCLKREKDGKK